MTNISNSDTTALEDMQSLLKSDKYGGDAVRLDQEADDNTGD
jgi:hypothetical protein